MNEVAQGLALADGGNQRLGSTEDIRDVRAALVGHASDVAGGGDETPVHGVALDDAGVVLDADRCRQFCDKAAEVGDAADVLELVLAVEHRARR